VRVAYADPPYPGCAHLYPEKIEVDHVELVGRLLADFDGFILHTSSVAQRFVESLLPMKDGKNGPVPDGWRTMPWVKPFAAFKKNVPVAYAWEPVIVKAVRKPVVRGRAVMRDWIAASSTLKKCVIGSKPLDVCLWAFEMAGLEPADELVDLYPAEGAVTAAWTAWKAATPSPGAGTKAREP
jgi:hypothetical protein